MIPFSPFKMRLPPMGPTIDGENDGDTFVWDAAGRGWTVAPGVVPPSSETEFDALISTRADLVAVVAPVGGEFLLPSGSYFWKEEVDLDEGESIVIDGTTVFMMGGGTPSPLLRGFNGNAGASNPALVIRNGGDCHLLNMRVGAVQIARHGILLNGGTLRCDFSQIPSSTGGSQPALEVLDGDVKAFRSFFGGAVAGVELSGGDDWVFTECDIWAGLSGVGLAVAPGAGDKKLFLTRCHLRGSAPTNSPAMTLEGPQTEVWADHCELEGPGSAGSVVSIIELSSLSVIGGFVFGTGAAPVDGFRFDGGAVGGGVQFVGVSGEYLDDLIQSPVGGSGTTRRVVVCACDTAADVVTGVDWSFANMPADGLLELGNQFDSLTPFESHSASDALVNRKVNSFASGLVAETAIVP